jgi:hypothetical protein
MDTVLSVELSRLTAETIISLVGLLGAALSFVLNLR